MTNITGVLVRVFVSDLDAAIPLYQELAGTADVRRFSFRDVQLARVGPFLLLAGNTAAYRDRVATILVSRHAPVIAAIENSGGQIIEGPSAAPNGPRLIARHRAYMRTSRHEPRKVSSDPERTAEPLGD